MSTRRSPVPKPIEAVVASLGGIVRQKDLLLLGFSSRRIRAAVAGGLIQRRARGVYAAPQVSAQDTFLAAHQARRTCLSKAAELGLWVLQEPKQLHVATAHGRPVPGCVVHRVKGGQTLADVLRQCVRCGTEVEALAILESAVVNRKCSINHLRNAFTGREDAAGRAIVGMIDPQSMSIAETCSRYHLRKVGHNVQGQAYVRNAGHMDLLIDGILGLEIDSKKYHNDPKAWEQDLHRDTMYVLEGMWRLRIPAAIAMYHPEIMVGWVEQALARIRSAQIPEMR